MAQNYSAQSTITIRRTRTNDGLSLAFRNLGGPLYQFVDSTTGDVGPDWTNTDANRPIIQPMVTSVQGATVEKLGCTWTYNGMPLVFDGATEGDWAKTSDGVFGLRSSDKALKIFKNLADSSNIASDNLGLSIMVRVLGVEYTLNGQVTVAIQSGGTAAYFVVLNTDNGPELSNAVASTTITARIFLGAAEQANLSAFDIEWWKDNVLATSGGNTLLVSRNDVDGAQLYICKVKVGGNVVAAAAINIQDLADEMQVEMRITSGVDVSDGNNVTVEAALKNSTTNTIYDSTNSSGMTFNWTLAVYRKTDSDYSAIRTVTSTNPKPTITITTADTDAGGVITDVDLLAEVEVTIS